MIIWFPTIWSLATPLSSLSCITKSSLKIASYPFRSIWKLAADSRSLLVSFDFDIWLPDDFGDLFGLLEDDQGRLWISLSIFNARYLVSNVIHKLLIDLECREYIFLISIQPNLISSCLHLIIAFAFFLIKLYNMKNTLSCEIIIPKNHSQTIPNKF